MLLSAISTLALASLTSAQLPPYDGKYGVGTVTLEVPVSNARSISNENLVSTGQPAFQLESILITIYYPASKTNTSAKPNPPWLPPPIDLLVRGIAASTNGSISPQLISVGFTALAGSALIPAFVDVPIANASSFPVFIFSHGDISLPQWYSRYLGQVAASGVVVAAITHRDGSNAGSQVIIKGQQPRNVTYITPQQVSPSLDATGLVLLKRQFRQAEVDEAIRLLKAINAGQGGSIFQSSSRGEGETLAGWRDHLDFGNLVVGGHSLGAASALDTLQTPNSSDYSIRAGLTLDPGKESGVLSTNITIPLLIPDSQAFSAQAPFEFYGLNHFNTVKSIAQHSLDATGAGWFMTLLGSAHVSITDAELIGGSALLSYFDSGAKNATIKSADAIERYVDISREFFQFLRGGNRSGLLASGVTDPTFVPRPNSSFPGNESSYWEVHVAPVGTPAKSGGSQPLSAAISSRCGMPSVFIVLSLVFLTL